jgi:hypothetical protein
MKLAGRENLVARNKDAKKQSENDESEEMATQRQWSTECRIVLLAAATIAGVVAVFLRMLRK